MNEALLKVSFYRVLHGGIRI